jgi:exosortase A
VQVQTHVNSEIVGSPNWLHGTFLLALIATAVAFGPTYAEMAQIWFGNDTYVHGAFVGPVVLWLVWRERDRLRSVPAQPSAAGVCAVLAVCAVWVGGGLFDANIVEHLAATSIVAAIVLAVYGPHVVRALAFPLGFLLLATPVGEWLVPALMEYTADFTVTALKLTGFAVYREGLYFSTAKGDFAVEKACSGIRYLIASLTVGLLFAHLTFRTLRRAVIFVALAVVVPLIANGVRAWLIVVVAHVSDMRLAVGVDHFIYGWVLFGVVMAILFSIGFAMQRREPVPVVDPSRDTPPVLLPQSRSARIALPLAAVAALLLAPVVLEILSRVRDAS